MLFQGIRQTNNGNETFPSALLCSLLSEDREHHRRIQMVLVNQEHVRTLYLNVPLRNSICREVFQVDRDDGLCSRDNSDGENMTIFRLILAIENYIDSHNQNPKPFIRTAKARDILEKVTRAKAALNKRRSA